MDNKLTPDEVVVMQMALSGLIEDLEATSGNPSLPFTPEARKYQKEMLAAAKSALAKVAAVSGKLIKLDPYNEGDETEFLTKES